MVKKIVTLYIDDTSIRLVAAQGKQIKKWADSPLEPGLVKNGVVIEEAEVATRIKHLLKAMKIKAKRVNVGVSGLHCLSRPIILPQLPKEMLDEAVKREAKRALPVPLEQLYLSWQTVPAPEGKIKVFLVAIPCKMADALLKMLHQVGLKPDLMDIKPLLLTRLVKEATAVIVDVQPTEFDIVIMGDGVPQPIRTVSLPSEASTWQEKLPLIRDDLDRTIKFYNSNNPEKNLVSSIPIFVSGALTDEPELCQALSDELGYPVLPLPPSRLKYPKELDLGRYTANIGMVLKKLTSRSKTGPSVTNLNALPAVYRAKPVSLTSVLAVPSAAIAIGLIVFMVMFIQSVSADIASTRNRIDSTSQFLRLRLSQRQELMDNIARAEASRDSFTAALASIEKQSNEVNGDLVATINSLPSTISLSSITHAGGILTINGRAPSEKGALSYLESLDASGRFREITITDMQKTEGEGMDFTLLGSLKTQSNGVSSMEVLVNTLPTTASLTSVSSTKDTWTVDGRATSEKGVLAYLESLDASGRFREITITNMKKTEDEGMDFTLILKVKEQE